MKAEKKEAYSNTLYITPFLYINSDGDKSGNSLLFVFIIGRTKDFSSKFNIIQKYISFSPNNDSFSAPTIISFDEPDTPLWIDNMESVSMKNSTYFVPKVVPNGFWSLGDEFIKIGIDKLSASALNAAINISIEPFSTFEVEITLEKYSLKNSENAVVFKLAEEYPSIKLQKTQKTQQSLAK